MEERQDHQNPINRFETFGANSNESSNQSLITEGTDDKQQRVGFEKLFPRNQDSDSSIESPTSMTRKEQHEIIQERNEQKALLLKKDEEIERVKKEKDEEVERVKKEKNEEVERIMQELLALRALQNQPSEPQNKKEASEIQNKQSKDAR